MCVYVRVWVDGRARVKGAAPPPLVQPLSTERAFENGTRIRHKLTSCARCNEEHGALTSRHFIPRCRDA